MGKLSNVIHDFWSKLFVAKSSTDYTAGTMAHLDNLITLGFLIQIGLFAFTCQSVFAPRSAVVFMLPLQVICTQRFRYSVLKYKAF